MRIYKTAYIEVDHDTLWDIYNDLGASDFSVSAKCRDLDASGELEVEVSEKVLGYLEENKYISKKEKEATEKEKVDYILFYSM